MKRLIMLIIVLGVLSMGAKCGTPTAPTICDNPEECIK